MLSLSEQSFSTPQVPPRRKSIEKETTPLPKVPDQNEEKENEQPENGEKQTISVKERTQKFNRLASVDEDLSPRSVKEKKKLAEKKVRFFLLIVIVIVRDNWDLSEKKTDLIAKSRRAIKTSK